MEFYIVTLRLIMTAGILAGGAALVAGFLYAVGIGIILLNA